MFASLFPKVAPKTKPASRRARLGVEVLEGRATPSTVLISSPLLFANTTALSGTTGPGDPVPSLRTGEEIPQ